MNRNPTILLAEDNEDHVQLIQDAFKKAGWLNSIQATRSGEETKKYLRGEAPFDERARYPYPVCLLLDLNMPDTNGVELLKWIRAQPEHKRLLVFILTSDKSDASSRLVYDLAANCLLRKPMDFDGTVKMVESIRDYLQVIQLPPPPENPAAFSPRSR
jgi:CheY-like chemotaxis protein